MLKLSYTSVIIVLFSAGAALADDAPEPASGETTRASADRLTAGMEEDTSWHQEVLVMMIGGGVRVRRLDYDVNDGMGATRELDTGPYFDFGWHMLIRPLGQRSPRPTMRAIVLQIDGGTAIGLNLERDGISLDTNAWRMVGQFGYLYPTGKFQVGGLVGIGGDVFNVDLNPVLPSSRIVYVRVGPAGSVDIAGRFFRIRADFGVRVPFHYGELANAFGKDTRGVGLDAMLTLGGHLEAGFSYDLRFLWEYYHLNFRGPTDPVPSEGGGGGVGNDHALALQLLVGWSL